MLSHHLLMSVPRISHNQVSLEVPDRVLVWVWVLEQEKAKPETFRASPNAWAPECRTTRSSDLIVEYSDSHRIERKRFRHCP